MVKTFSNIEKINFFGYKNMMKPDANYYLKNGERP